jgi:hypothetical protein
MLAFAVQPLRLASAQGAHPGRSVVHLDPLSYARVVNLSKLHRTASARQGPSLPFLHPGGLDKLTGAKADAASMGTTPGVQVMASDSPSPQTLQKLKGTTALNYTDTTCGCLPPDGAATIGNGYIMAGVNTAFKVLNGSGTVMGPTEFSTFMSAGGCDSTYSDPTLEYDNTNNRFLMMILTYDVLGNSSVCLAVSQTNNPTGNWYFYNIPVAVPAGHTTNLLDQPRLGIGTDALYITGNQFADAETTYLGPRVYAVNEAQAYSGGPITSEYTDVSANYDTLNPAQNIGTAANPYTEAGYFLAADDGICPPTCSNVYLWKWSDPFGANSFTFQGQVAVTTFAQPVTAKQNGGSVATNDSRELAAYYYNGTIYGAHAISCNPGTGTVDCVQWYQVGNIDGAPTLVQQGIVSGNGTYRYFPQLSVDKSGDVLLGYSYSSSSAYIGINYTGRTPSDPLGTMETEGTMKAGQSTDPTAIERWGDYAASSVYSDGCTLAYLEEYAPSNARTNIWSTWVNLMKFSTCH